MKLINLLSYIPDECKICLSSLGEQRHGVIDYKYDAIARFAYRYKLTRDQVKKHGCKQYLSMCVRTV